MSKKTALLVCDNKKFSEETKKSLKEHNYNVQVAITLEDATRILSSNAFQDDYDIIILDPYINGSDNGEAVSKLRETGTCIPITLITDKDTIKIDDAEQLRLGVFGSTTSVSDSHHDVAKVAEKAEITDAYLSGLIKENAAIIIRHALSEQNISIRQMLDDHEHEMVNEFLKILGLNTNETMSDFKSLMYNTRIWNKFKDAALTGLGKTIGVGIVMIFLLGLYHWIDNETTIMKSKTPIMNKLP